MMEMYAFESSRMLVQVQAKVLNLFLKNGAPVLVQGVLGRKLIELLSVRSQILSDAEEGASALGWILGFLLRMQHFPILWVARS